MNKDLNGRSKTGLQGIWHQIRNQKATTQQDVEEWLEELLRKNANVAQMVRAVTCQVTGRGLKSHHSLNMNTNTIGRISELIAQAKFIQLGYVVLQPVNKDGIYDFVIEKDGVFSKIQVKTAQDKVDYVTIYGKSISMVKGKAEIKRYYKTDIDYIVGVIQETKEVFMMDIEEASTQINLRRTKPRNNQKLGIKYLKDYLI